MQSTVIQIGKDAIDKDDPVVILFGETATEALQNVSVIQRFEQTRPMDRPTKRRCRPIR